MATDKQNKKKGITPEKIIAYVESRAGKPQSKVARDMGIGQATVSRWTGEIDDYVKSSPQYQQAIKDLTELIPDAVQVYKSHVDPGGDPLPGNPDLAAARDVLKMMSLFIEKKAHEHKGVGGSDADLWAELAQFVATESGSDESGPGTDSQG